MLDVINSIIFGAFKVFRVYTFKTVNCVQSPTVFRGFKVVKVYTVECVQNRVAFTAVMRPILV